VLYLFWIFFVKVLNDTFSLLVVDGVSAVHAELGKFKLLATKLGQGAAAPCPCRVLHLQGIQNNAVVWDASLGVVCHQETPYQFFTPASGMFYNAGIDADAASYIVYCQKAAPTFDHFKVE